MAKISKEQVLKLATLSRLQLSDEEVQKYQEDLSRILDYFEQLESIDVEGLKPAYQVGVECNSMRADETVDYQAKPEDLRKLPPKRDGDYIEVGRMIG